MRKLPWAMAALLAFSLLIGCRHFRPVSETDANSVSDDYRRHGAILFESDGSADRSGTNRFTLYRCDSRYLPPDSPGSLWWKGTVPGEYLIVEIIGTVRRVELIRTSWDGAELRDGETIQSVENPKDCVIVIDTYFAESSPNEKLKIEAIDGTVFSYEINEKDLR